MDIDPLYVLAGGAFLLGILDKGAALVERLAGRVTGLRRFDSARARRIVHDEEERAALRELAQRHEQIVALLSPNGGSSVADRVNASVAAAQEAASAAGTAARAAARAEAVAGEVRNDLREHIEQSRQVHGALFARLDAQGRGDA
ncbi:MAG: hypothetical protein CVU47_10740 [Chloroflexi bacterium HGW-Chloroflexi-9]|nr:MAG: hypothetical protein CVU47_10740 [Chloroflexi bacterium HGW-Chloroflexi-9]